MFCHRASAFVLPELERLDKELFSLSQEKARRSEFCSHCRNLPKHSVACDCQCCECPHNCQRKCDQCERWTQLCEGKIFQSDLELQSLEKRFSLCLEPWKCPSCIVTQTVSWMVSLPMLKPPVTDWRCCHVPPTFCFDGKTSCVDLKWSDLDKQMILKQSPAHHRCPIVDSGHCVDLKTDHHGADEQQVLERLGEFNLVSKCNNEGVPRHTTKLPTSSGQSFWSMLLNFAIGLSEPTMEQRALTGLAPLFF